MKFKRGHFSLTQFVAFLVLQASLATAQDATFAWPEVFVEGDEENSVTIESVPPIAVAQPIVKPPIVEPPMNIDPAHDAAAMSILPPATQRPTEPVGALAPRLPAPPSSGIPFGAPSVPEPSFASAPASVERAAGATQPLNGPPTNEPHASVATSQIPIAPPPLIGTPTKSIPAFNAAYSGVAHNNPNFDPSTSGDVALIHHVQPCDGCDAHSCCRGCGGCCHSCVCPLPEAPCVDCPRITMQNPYFNVSLFGALKLDMLFNAARPISPGTPFFLTPDANPGLNEQTFDAHARQSMLGAALAGPTVGGYKAGGMIMATFYNDAIIVDQYGFLPLQAYGELTSPDTRFAAGLQFDVFCPGAPTVLPFSVLNASGNAGNAFRGQVRFERFIRPSADRQWTLQIALSEPIATTIDPLFRLAEDNGWPNIEGRIAVGCGCLPQGGIASRRPVEVGVSAVVGQLRTTLVGTNQVIADVWGLGIDYYWQITDQIGVAGELFTGQGLGTYNAGVLQGINQNTGRPIEAAGGWIEFFAYWTPCLHSHYGFGVDDPNDSQIIPRGRSKNETYFANLIWDMNSTFRVGCELAWRNTDYLLLADNDGLGFHTQFQWSF